MSDHRQKEKQWLALHTQKDMTEICAACFSPKTKLQIQGSNLFFTAGRQESRPSHTVKFSIWVLVILKVFSNLKDSVSCDNFSEKRTEVQNYFIDWAVSFKYNRHVVFYVLNRHRKARIPCDSASRFCIPFSVKTLSISLDGILKYVMALVFYSFNNLFLFLTTCLLKWNNYFSVENFYQYKNKLSICVLTIKTFCESGLYLSTYSIVPSRDLLRC